jgi:hypothetical protein
VKSSHEVSTPRFSTLFTISQRISQSFMSGIGTIST